MATRRAPRAASKPAAPKSLAELAPDLVALRERLRAEGAVKVSSILPKTAKAELTQQLAAEGYELAGTWLRRPVREQMREALGHGAALTKTALASLVRGASAPELARVASELEKGGELHRVLRGKSETFTGSGSQVLAPPSLAALKPLIAQLHQALATVSRKKGMTLLASDVDELLAGAREALGETRSPRRVSTHVKEVPNAEMPIWPGSPCPSPAQRGRGEPGTDLGHEALERHAAPRSVAASPQASNAGSSGRSGSLLDVLDATRDARTGLSFVPRVVERLLPSVSLAVAHEMLLQAARDERIELRPEGGLGRLTNDELGLCPAGPGGMRLSWARRLDGTA
jgi:hypothetical protein